MENFKIISVSENRKERERIDGKPSREFVTVVFGSLNKFNNVPRTRNMFLQKHGKDNTLVDMTTTGDEYRKMIGQTVKGEVVTVNHRYVVNAGTEEERTVNTWTGLLFDFELSSEAARTQALSKLMPKATVIAEVVAEVAEEAAEEIPSDIRA